MTTSFPGLIGCVIGRIYPGHVDDIGMVVGWSDDNLVVVVDGGRLVSVPWDGNIAVTGQGEMIDCNDPEGTT